MAPSAVLLVRDNMPKRCAPPSHSAAELGVTQPFASHEAPLEKVSQCIGGGDGSGGDGGGDGGGGDGSGPRHRQAQT